MMQINAANTAALPTTAKPAEPKGYRLRADAEAAAVLELGPQAIKGFDFTTTKCDGRWLWRRTDEDDRKPTAAMIKAAGGKQGFEVMQAKRSLVAMAAELTGTAIDAAKTDKLPVPPRRVPSQTPEKAAGAPDGGAGAGQPPSDDDAPKPAVTPNEGTYEELKESGGLRSAPVPVPAPGQTAATCSPIPGIRAIRQAAADAALDIPPFLKRESTPEEMEKVRKKLAKQVGPGRAIKDPPDAKAAAKRAEKARAAEAKFEGTPAHARQKAKDAALAKAGDNGTKAGKRASKPRTATATVSGGKTKTAIVGELLSRPEGCTTADILAATGWPSVSVPAQAKAVGLTLRKEKDGSVTRYFGSK